MSGFTLDTSGYAVLPSQGGTHQTRTWGELSPFTQGYIEAALRDAGVDRYDRLATETLARIIADCEAADKASRDFGYQSTGLEFWKVRQAGLVDAFPPLTVQLGDDGKMRFATQESRS